MRRQKCEYYKVGDKLWEGEYSAGHIVSKMQCPERPMRVWMLLRNDNSQYTIYSAEKNMECKPTVARMIPEAVVNSMFMESFMGVKIPDKITKLKGERSPVE